MRKGGLSGSRASPSANTNLQTVKPSKRGSSQRLQGLDFCFCYVSFDPLESRKGDTSCRSRREDYSKIFRHRMVEVVRHKTEGDLPTGLVRMQGTSTPLCGLPSLHLHCSRQKECVCSAVHRQPADGVDHAHAEARLSSMSCSTSGPCLMMKGGAAHVHVVRELLARGRRKIPAWDSQNW